MTGTWIENGIFADPTTVSSRKDPVKREALG
jgi:hypothetical protein